MTNIELAKLFRNVAAAYSITDEKKFRFQIIAYQRSADAIESSTEEVHDLYKEGKLDTIPGVGETIKGRLEELFKTGKVAHFDELMKKVPASVFVLMEVPTFGPKKAFKLVDEFHLNDPKTVIQEVVKLATDGRIATLEGFGEKSQADILRAIGEHKKGFGKTTRMALPFAAELADKVITYIKKCPAVKEVQPLGSLRRRVATVGDLDIAVSTDKPKEVIAHFVAYPYTERIIEKGEVSSSLITSGGQQVDLLTVPADSFGSLLQHFTGSKHHNVHLRELAIKKGMSLSERGIKRKHGDKETMEKFKTEEKFYEALGMDWIPPEMREDTGEIELALTHKLPKLITLADMKGDLHIHSSYPIQPSHDLGANTMENMIEKAISLKYEYIGFSEHNPSISKHTKAQVYALLEKRQQKIEALRKKYPKIHIISLMETDILPNGSLALDDKALSFLDATLVSVHSVFSLDEKDMTKRVLSGLAHPKAKILSHPTGRLLNDRPSYDLNWNEVFTFCKKNNKALEINASPSRLDLPDTLVRQAVVQDVTMVIDTDSHATSQMDLMQYGVSVARRGFAEKKNIANTWNYKEFSEWLKS